MSHKYEVILDDETYKAVKKMAERGIRRGKGEAKPVTIGEMCASLVHTGAFRRIAANKWAKAHPAKKTKKPARKAKSAKKSPAKGSKKPARVRKPKAAKAKPAPAPVANGEAMKPSLPAQAGGVLD
jgi:hypothetical protein